MCIHKLVTWCCFVLFFVAISRHLDDTSMLRISVLCKTQNKKKVVKARSEARRKENIRQVLEAERRARAEQNARAEAALKAAQLQQQEQQRILQKQQQAAQAAQAAKEAAAAKQAAEREMHQQRMRMREVQVCVRCYFVVLFVLLAILGSHGGGRLCL